MRPLGFEKGKNKAARHPKAWPLLLPVPQITNHTRPWAEMGGGCFLTDYLPPPSGLPSPQRGFVDTQAQNHPCSLGALKGINSGFFDPGPQTSHLEPKPWSRFQHPRRGLLLVPGACAVSPTWTAVVPRACAVSLAPESGKLTRTPPVCMQGGTVPGVLPTVSALILTPAT